MTAFRTCLGLLISALALAAAQAQTSQTPQSLPTIKLGAGIHNIRAQVAQNDEQRMIGLMFRPSMPNNDGMLFAFPEPAQQCFWMKNTLLPLSAAFVADDGTIVNIEDMKPQTTTPHCSKKPVRFVLEMNQGWFAKRNIGAGFKLTGEAFKP